MCSLQVEKAAPQPGFDRGVSETDLWTTKKITADKWLDEQDGKAETKKA